jgi:predicted RNA binding protein YcfA (HicA-like mRNA interferase family)
MTVREIIEELELAGWVLVLQTGQRRHFRHGTRSGGVCVAGSLGHDVPEAVIARMARYAGVDAEPR